MLLQRILTAIPLALTVIWLILFQPTDVFVYLLYLISLISGYEWARLSGSRNKVFTILYATILTAVAFVVINTATEVIEWLVYFSILFWLYTTATIKTVKPNVQVGGLKGVSYKKLVTGLLVVPTAVMSMWVLHRFDNGDWLMYGLSLIWVADIGAYFSGKQFGKHKLAENISPGKTIEGLLGAVVFTSIYTVFFASDYFALNTTQTFILVAISLLLTIVSVVGDLYESILKREMAMKDSGTILPGHGGILDRIDSVLSAMPLFSVLIHYFVFSVYGN